MPARCRLTGGQHVARCRLVPDYGNVSAVCKLRYALFSQLSALLPILPINAPGTVDRFYGCVVGDPDARGIAATLGSTILGNRLCQALLACQCERLPLRRRKTERIRPALQCRTGRADKILMQHPNPDFSSYFAPELAVRSKRQITKGIGNEEAVEWKTVCVAPDQSVCSACFAKRANAARDQRSILARTALSLRFCLVAAW